MYVCVCVYVCMCVCVCVSMYVSVCMYMYVYIDPSIPGKRPYSTFQGVNIAASMQFMSLVSAHVGQNCELCLSVHGRLPGTLW